MPTDFRGLSAVTLLRLHELYAAAAVPMLAPLDKRIHPLAGPVLPAIWPSWVIRPFAVGNSDSEWGVVIADARPRELTEHAQFLQPSFQSRRTHAIAVDSVEDQRLAAPLADPLSQASPAHQFCCDGGIFSLGDIPVHHFATPVIDQ